jgi:cytochrome c oxidase subunit 2
MAETSPAHWFFGAVLKVFDPHSPQARAIFHLGIETSVVLAMIFALVTGLILYALMRFRWREGEAEPRQVAGNRTIELIWTAIPCLIVIALFLLTAHTMAVSDPPPAPAPDLIVTGHQWWWEARYPKTGVVAANEIHIPVGRALSVQLESNDVLHEFWVPQLARKIATVPGHPNHIWIEADQPGTYLGICSEFCGTEHAWMHFLIVAQTPADYAAWESAQLRTARLPQAALALQGHALFLQMSCASCHAVNGTVAHAQVGPDLTHFASRRQIGAGIVANTPANLRRWLADPQQVKPGVKMPNFKFTDEQLAQFVAYLGTLR